MTTATERLRALNDQLRTTFVGGTVMITRGIEAIPFAKRKRILERVRSFGCKNLAWCRQVCQQETRRDPQHRGLHLTLDRGLRRDTEDHAPVRLVRSKGLAELLLLGGSQRKAIQPGPQRHRVFRARLTRKEQVVSVKLHFCTERVIVQKLERP